MQKPVEIFLSKLENVKERRGGWQARCPNHNDKVNSLSISEGKDERVLSYCHAGCANENIVNSIGLQMSDLFERDERERTKHYNTKNTFRRSKITQIYDYHDQKGDLLFQVCRTESKQFPLRRPDGKGSWIWNLGDVRTTIYRLPRILEAIQEGQKIMIVEGEKDVDRLEGAAFYATTSPQGAGKWKERYNPMFQDAEVILIPDNDKPGRKHMLDIARQLYGITKSIQIIELSGLEEKGDLSDWFDQGNSANKLLKLIKETPLWDPDVKEDVKMLSFKDLKSLIGPIEWTWKSWLLSNLLTILASEPGIGKSALALRLAATFITGQSWPDGSRYEGEKGTVLWCEAEAAQGINLERAEKWNIPLDKIYLPPIGDPLQDIQLDNPLHRKAILKTAQRQEVKFVVVDSLRGSHRQDENASQSIEIVMWLAKLARDSQTPVLLTHHLRKRGNHDGKEITLDRLRGSSAIVQPARVIWAMDTPNSEKFECKRLSVIKSNIGRFPEPIGFSVNESGIEFSEAPAENKKVGRLEEAKEILLEMLEEGGVRQSKVINFFQEKGISRSTVYRARKELGIQRTKNGQNQYIWFIDT